MDDRPFDEKDSFEHICGFGKFVRKYHIAISRPVFSGFSTVAGNSFASAEVQTLLPG
jgi:hypothetical protein